MILFQIVSPRAGAVIEKNLKLSSMILFLLFIQFLFCFVLLSGNPVKTSLHIPGGSQPQRAIQLRASHTTTFQNRVPKETREKTERRCLEAEKFLRKVLPVYKTKRCA